MTRLLLVLGLVTVATVTILRSGGGIAMVEEVAVLPVLLGVVLGTALAAADHAASSDDDPVGPSSVEDRPHASMAGRVRAAARSRHDVHTQLLPVLRPLVEQTCRTHHVDPEDREAVAELVGRDLADLLTLQRDPLHDRDAPGLPIVDTARMIDRLEDAR